jgi:dolichol-phosphate mannosyltransferase
LTRANDLVVVPTLNEAENLPGLAERLLGLEPAVDVLIVDDRSGDGTGDIAERIAGESGGRLAVLHRTGRVGLGPAYRDGFRRALDAGYGRIVQMDADFSHDPESVPTLLERLDDADLVLGSRYVEGGGTKDWGLLRRWVSRGGNRYARVVLGMPYSDLTGGFKAWRRETLAATKIDKIRSNGYCFQIEMTYRAHRAGARIAEMPIEFPDRRVGRSKMSKAIFFEAVWRLPLLRFQ